MLFVALACAVGSLAPASAQTTGDLFNGDVLHRVELWLHSQDWEKLKQNFQENTYYPADFTWNGITVRNAGIRSRGLGSRSTTKPGLRVDIDRYASEQTFLGLKSFILDNLTQDASGVRETVTMKLFARLGIPAPREAHTRLYINGDYAGVYALVESVDKDLLARVFGEIDGDVQNDGYLFEYDYDTNWRFDDLGSSLDPYKIKFDAQTHEDRSDTEKWQPIAELVRLINETPLDRFKETVGERLDLTAAVRYIAAQNFVAENDGVLGYAGVNNFYFYRLENSSRHVFIAWDEDNAFMATDFALTTRHSENVLMRRAMEVPELRTLYYDTLNEAATSAAEAGPGEAPWLEREIRRQLDLIDGAMRDDVARPYNLDDFAAARSSMVAFASGRISYVRCEVARQTGRPVPAGCSQ
ncbi:MAG: CotH kinase family protein [Vicinamibacterales bacterium]